MPMLRLSSPAAPSGRTPLSGHAPRSKCLPLTSTRAAWRPAGGGDGEQHQAATPSEARSVFATSPPSGDATLFDAR